MARVITFVLLLLAAKGMAQQADTITIIGVGDIMMGTNFPDDRYLPPSNGKYLLSSLSNVLQDADITFGNLEGVILDEGGLPKNCKNPKICFLFRSPESYLQHLVDAGFDLMSTANNHINDFGVEGRNATAKALNAFGLAFAGFSNKPTTIIEKNGIKYGLAAFAPNQGASSMANIKRASALVAGLDSLVDIVIVSIHGGAEGKDHQHVTKKDEIFLGHNRGNIYSFAHLMVDAGADVIFGHGPHVTRAVDYYKNRFISYSLGNFCTYRRFNLSGESGYAPIMKVYLDRSGAFIKAEVVSIKQVPPGGPRLDEESNTFRLLEQLTKQDIPEAMLKFEGNNILPLSDR